VVKTQQHPPICQAHEIQQTEEVSEHSVPLDENGTPQFDPDDPLAYWLWYYNVGDRNN
jgi:hypothetical protein